MGWCFVFIKSELSWIFPFSCNDGLNCYKRNKWTFFGPYHLAQGKKWIKKNPQPVLTGPTQHRVILGLANFYILRLRLSCQFLTNFWTIALFCSSYLFTTVTLIIFVYFIFIYFEISFYHFTSLIYMIFWIMQSCLDCISMKYHLEWVNWGYTGYTTQLQAPSG